MSKKNPKIDTFLSTVKTWRAEYDEMRRIVLESPLIEELKWKHPCYTNEGKNIVILHGFKEYFAISFFKGSLMKDDKNLLVSSTENMTSGRQLRFTSAQAIRELEEVIKSYILEAIEVEKSGEKIVYKTVSDFEVPEELQHILNENEALNVAFEALTPGRRKAYLMYFGDAKQSQTRITRIENSIDRIMCGKGLNDCICGLTKRKPNCDGSHKQLKN